MEEVGNLVVLSVDGIYVSLFANEEKAKQIVFDNDVGEGGYKIETPPLHEIITAIKQELEYGDCEDMQMLYDALEENLKYLDIKLVDLFYKVGNELCMTDTEIANVIEERGKYR